MAVIGAANVNISGLTMSIVTHQRDSLQGAPHELDVLFRDSLDFRPPVLPSLEDMQDVAAQYSWYDSGTGQDVVDNSDPWGISRGLRRHTAGFVGAEEGRTFQLRLSPGVVAVASHNEVKRENTAERGVLRQILEGDMAGSWVNTETGEIGDVDDFQGIKARKGRQVITEWSKKSRRNMMLSMGALDYSDWVAGSGDLAMVTLTYPNQWEKLVPTGEDFKRHFRVFIRRWKRAVGPWVGLWKMEFQRRGAPHMHMLLKVPAMVKGRLFEHWLSHTWADIVGASDQVDGLDRFGEPSSEYSRHLAAGTGVDFSGQKFSDPRRIALYFLGHSMKSSDGKEYQHIVPEMWQRPGAGPGRFWGAGGLRSASVAVDLDLDEFVRVRRCLRHVLASRSWVTAVIRDKAAAKRENRRSSSVFDIKVRKAWTLGSSGGLSGGSVLLNNGYDFSLDLSRVVARGPVEAPGGSAAYRRSFPARFPGAVLPENETPTERVWCNKKHCCQPSG